MKKATIESLQEVDDDDKLITDIDAQIAANKEKMKTASVEKSGKL